MSDPRRTGWRAAGTVAEDDPHVRALLEHVRPADWSNPPPRERYHLVVVGAGTAGLVTAAAAAGLGARVALVERHRMGGDCLNYGCVPSKALLRAAHAWHDARTAAERFGGPAAAGDGDFATVMERMRRLRAGIAPVDSAQRFASLGVDVYFGEARFTDGTTIGVGEHVLRFRRAVIATGARASMPPIEGLADAGFLTNETFFDLVERPERLAIIGAGAIGCEIAQAMARLGCRVTLLDTAPRILPREDADAADVLAGVLRRDGVVIHTGVEIRSVRRSDDGSCVVTFGDSTLSADAVLVATGRQPNVEGLGLEAVGVEYDHQGVRVDARLRTTARNIFAVGDVCTTERFTHLADWHARIVVQNALFPGRAKHTDLVIPRATYTAPELAHVGLTAEEAEQRGLLIDTLTVELEHVDRAVLEGATDGFFRVHLRKGKDRIVGATLLGERAGDMISEICLAMTNGLGLSAIGATIHPYPTQAEVFRKAADQWRRGKLTPTVRRILDLYFRLRG